MSLQNRAEHLRNFKNAKQEDKEKMADEILEFDRKIAQNIGWSKTHE